MIESLLHWFICFMVYVYPAYEFGRGIEKYGLHGLLDQLFD